MYKTLTVFHVIILGHITCSQTNVTVTTSKGAVVGLRLNPNPTSGVSYDAFLGVPYGDIPARFQPPVARSAWSSPLVAHGDGPACPQHGRPFNEDCLYLNVFTPVNASLNPGRLTVMVFVHGSAFTSGSSSSSSYGPDFLVPRDVILVTLNYRLGAAGYLTLGTPEAPGNLGIYDVLQALRWVQTEISSFGGDPGLVTLVGHSAGSAIVQFLYISPLSTGLFRYAISQSGSALSDDHTLSAEEAVRRAKLLATAVGCDPGQSNPQLLSCLQSADINNIVRYQNISLPTEVLASGVTIRFRPVLDTSFGKPPFFTDTLENMIKETVKTARPLLTGFVTEEGIILFQMDYGWMLVEDNVDGFIPQRLQGTLSTSGKASIVSKIRSKYFPEKIDRSKILDIVKIYSDTIFIYPNIEFTRYFANVTYAYVFTYRGPWTPLPENFSRFQVTGVQHGAELAYLFYSGQDVGQCALNLPSLHLRDLMVDWWTTFAKTGTPDPTGVWQRVSDKGEYRLIGNSISTVNCSEVEDRYYNFWATLDSSSGSAQSALLSLRVNPGFFFMAVFCLFLLLHCSKVSPSVSTVL